jgi:tRNA pseudouridine55 synthase
MADQDRKRRDIHGIVLLDKPTGLTSNQALQRVKRLCNARKAGHSGSLDPLATGMLPICLGEATKLSSFMLAANKSYDVRAALGAATTTGDSDGEVTEKAAVPALSEQSVLAALAGFVGKIEQVPPMYSALKHEGQRLYTLARKGIEVERPARSVHIHALDLVSYDSPTLELRVRCSKGTYVRTLVEDLAKALGTVAHVTALHRLAVAPFEDQGMTTLAAVESAAEAGPDQIDALLLPVDSALADWPRLIVAPDNARRLVQGQAVPAEPDWPESKVLLYVPGQRFFGIGEILPHRRLVPKRIFPGLSPWS